MRILITGDLVVDKEYNTKEKIDQSMIDLFTQSDINIVNLEAPVTDSESKILKTGPNIKSHRDGTVEVLQALKIDVATLANNHVLDYNEKGVEDTLEFCKDNNIKTVGAGMNLEQASKTLYFDSVEGIIAIVNFAENEWCSATSSTAGANPMDIIDNAKQINAARENADYVIVIIHGGHEYYNLPSPRMQKQYRFYAEQGADIVVGHHTHCISGFENWKGIPIYYSLGNFLFTHNSTFEDWYKGLVLEIEISDKKLVSNLHPIGQSKNSFDLKLLGGNEKSEIIERIEEYHNIITSNKELIEKWNLFVGKQSRTYLGLWSPLSFLTNKYLKAVFYKLNVKVYNKLGYSLYLNLIRCEAHRDLSKESIEKYLNK